MLPQIPTSLIVAGDFNCVQTDSDCTGHRYSSRALERLLNGLQFTDVWDASLNNHAYNHYTPIGAARLDRICATDSIRKHKQGVETLVAAFTDHLAVLLRVQLSIPFTSRGIGRWYLNTSYLDDSKFQDKLEASWKEWRKHVPCFPSRVHWWELYVKRKVKILFTNESTERNADRNRLENVYYSAIYDAIQEPIQHTQKMTTLKMLKAKLIRLNSTHRQKLTLDTGEQDKMIDENPSLHHLIKARKRQASRTIKKISDDQGITSTESFDIMKVFTIHFRKKFSPILMDGQSSSLLMNCELRKIT